MIEQVKILLYIMEAVACFTAFMYIRKLRQTPWIYFAVYLASIVVCEVVGNMLTRNNMRAANYHFYGYFVVPLEFLFFFWLFYKTYTGKKYKWLPMACTVLYIISWLLDNLWLNRYEFSFQSVSYTVGNLLLLLLILRYFIQLVTSEAILNFKRDMLFWISAGLLIFYLGSFPFYGLQNTMAHKYHELYTYASYITYLLDSLMYLMFTFSFIWGKPNIKSSSS